MLKDILPELVDRRNASRERMAEVFEHIFSGGATPAQLGAFLVALRMKGETPEEIAGAAEVMRRHATQVKTPPGRIVIDTCGTGGDGAQTFNISTAAALVVAGAGVTVAKHGNRSVSSQCGSADVLVALGVNVDAPVETVERCLEELDIGFLFAPALHAVMRHVGPARREVGVRSIFNLLGPLANPARAPRQLLGVYDRAMVPILAQTLLHLGAERALVVHGQDGLDEISPCGPTFAAWIGPEGLKQLELVPEDAGLERVEPAELKGGSAAHNAALLRSILEGQPGPLRRTVLLNAAGALWVAGVARDLVEGVAQGEQSIDSGRALAKLDGLRRLTAVPSEGTAA